MNTLRLRKLLHGGRTLLTPLDHGVAMGPIPGIARIRETVTELIEIDGVNAIVFHPGSLGLCMELLAPAPGVGTILHLNASANLSPQPNRKVMTATVEDALRLGADGVSVHINLGNPHDGEMLADLGAVAGTCRHWGMPLLAMIYVRGDGQDPLDPAANAAAARVAMELGADLIKVAHPGTSSGCAQVVDAVDVPVVFAGGPFEADDAEFLAAARGAMDAGAAGLAVGRNVFQRPDRSRFIAALARIVHQDASVAEAQQALEGSTS